MIKWQKNEQSKTLNQTKEHEVLTVYFKCLDQSYESYMDYV